MQYDFEIMAIRPARADQDFLGQVSFGYEPSKYEPVTIVRDYKLPGTDEWKKARTVEIDGARVVRVYNAFVKFSDKANSAYVQLPGLDIPWELACIIGQTALMMIEHDRREEHKRPQESGIA